MSTFLQLLDQMVLTAIAGQRAGDFLQTQALRNSVAEMVRETAEEDALYESHEAGSSPASLEMLSLMIDSDELDTGPGPGNYEGEPSYNPATATPTDTRYFNYHTKYLPEQKINKTKRFNQMGKSKFFDNTNSPDTITHRNASFNFDYPSRLSSPSACSSINTDDSVPDDVLNCPSITFMLLHQSLLSELHAVSMVRRKCTLDVAKAKRVTLGELPNGTCPAFLMGRPPTYEGMSPLAACYQEDEVAERKVVIKKFADV